MNHAEQAAFHALVAQEAVGQGQNAEQVQLATAHAQVHATLAMTRALLALLEEGGDVEYSGEDPGALAYLGDDQVGEDLVVSGLVARRLLEALEACESALAAHEAGQPLSAARRAAISAIGDAIGRQEGPDRVSRL